jgi:hypothetical protein
MKKVIAVLTLAAALPMFAQTTKPDTSNPPSQQPQIKSLPTPPEHLTKIETAALKGVSMEYQQVQEELLAIEIEIAKNHPGFHVDPANPFTDVIYPNTPPAIPATPPIKK